MNKILTVGLIGDQLPEYERAQRAALLMIERAAEELKLPTAIKWIPTRTLEGADIESQLKGMDALWASPGSPYLSIEGALRGIRFARERGWPLLGTCAGFQHIVLEYARNVMGITDAAHQEYEPEAKTLLLTALVCPVAHQTLKINLLPDSLPAKIYGRTEIEEYYYCNFGINPAFQRAVDESGLRVVGTDQDNEPRVLQLPGHRFYLATLFVPGASLTEGIVEMEGAHPLVKALLQAAVSFREEMMAKEEEEKLVANASR
jgi:CTP synthase (UTP-ammonia lyase)